ncbi:MAG: type II toxin-antitoxin system death-on-curing family toxin [Candidatus Aenigmarchaeota archaeon]|nr:type II toxin-antitoxin system death-on-curing family toxin [Candidatus Aenigmarchaeota archaeon]
MTSHLTFENILELNRVLINQFGDGPAEIKDIGTLEFIIDKASMAKDIYREAAILLYEINTKHPFWGGNKRTAFEAAKIFLRSNNIKIKIDYDEALKFINKMASGKITYQKTLEWIKEIVVK